jgi:hypothetical protein
MTAQFTFANLAGLGAWLEKKSNSYKPNSKFKPGKCTVISCPNHLVYVYANVFAHYDALITPSSPETKYR